MNPTLARLQVPALLLLIVLAILLPVDMTATGIPWPGLRSYGMLNLTRWLVIAIAAMGVNLIVHQAADAFRHFTCLGPDIARMHRTFAKALAERDAVLQA